MAESFDRSVVQVQVRNLEVGCAWNRLWVIPICRDREAVVLRGDQDPPSLEVFHGVIPPAVPVRELLGGSAKAECDQLMAQTDAENGNLAVGDLPDRVRSVGHGRR